MRTSVRCIAWLGLFIDDGFDPVSVRIKNESGEIVRTMFGMKAHASVVPSAVCQRRLVESGCRLLRRCSEGQMEALARRNDPLLTKADGKYIVGTGYAVADGRFLMASASFVSPSTDITKRSKNGIIKVGRTCEVDHAEGKMMEHMRRQTGLTRQR